MNLIKPYYEVILQDSGLSGIMRHIEICGRVAWKSEDKITEDSHIKFIDMLESVKHGSVLEHGTVYLRIPVTKDNLNNGILSRYVDQKYSKGNENDSNFYVTTNYRVLVENGWMDDLQYICEPTEHHEKRMTVRFVCDRGVSHEFVRHRVFSFTQESTRYCNYSKDKFGDELTFIMPIWMNDCGQYEKLIYGNLLKETENAYMNLVNGNAIINKSTSISDTQSIDVKFEKWKPQQARAVLPNSLKTELIMTGFESDWEHFFKLRDAESAHPQARELARPLHEYFMFEKTQECNL